MRDDQEIVPLRWWSLPTGETLGAVALIDRQHGYWKAYIGIGVSFAGGESATAQADAQRIAAWGTHLGEELARVLAPAEVDGLRFVAS